MLRFKVSGYSGICVLNQENIAGSSILFGSSCFFNRASQFSRLTEPPTPQRKVLAAAMSRLEDHRLMARTAAVGAPLRHPAFQRLWLGLSISYLGDQFTIIALLWFVLQLTGSGAAVGLVILCFDLVWSKYSNALRDHDLL